MENKPAREILAARLIELREESGLTQQELADKLNITRQSLSLYERAERTINIDLLLEISKVFDVSTDYLLGISDCKTTDADIKEICSFVNLSENAVFNIHEYTEFDCPACLMSGSMLFNKLCESEHILSLCVHLSTFWEMNRLYNLYKERLKRQRARGEDCIETENECKRVKEDTDYFKWSISNYVNEIIDYVLKINQDNKYGKLSSLTDEEIEGEIKGYYSLPSLLRDNIKCIGYLKDTIKYIRDEIQNKFK